MAMEENEENKTYQYLILLLGLASLVAATATLYLMEVLSISYGAGAGAIIQSNATHTNVTTVLVQAASQLTGLHNAINEVYIAALVAIGMLGSVLIIYVTRSRRFGPMSRRYTLLHTAFTLIYIALFYIVVSTYPLNTSGFYFILVYAAMATALIIDVYCEFVMRNGAAAATGIRRGMRIEPGMPFTNLVKLRDGIFATLRGHVRVVDKNFNSDAIFNLHRLLETSLSGIKKLDVITSAQTLDSNFQGNYTDFKNEILNRGIELNFLLMSEQDGVQQHERFIFDDEKAYKIPPLNIINKKSEHIVRLSVREARSRFDTLVKNSTKYDNYVVKQARGPET